MAGAVKVATLTLGLVVLVAGHSAAQGISEPPPPGFKVVAMFTGLRIPRGFAGGGQAPPDVITAVHCTNLGKEDTTMMVEVFGYDGGSVASGSITLGPGQTKTIT